MVRLEKVDALNLWDVIGLKVKRGQKSFVAPNDLSILEAYVSEGTGCSAFPFAIKNGKRVVGFLMIGFNEAALYELDGAEPPKALVNNYSLWRLMIDKRYQGRGYGREAVALALDFVRNFPCGKAEYCEVSYEPENETAAKLYHSFGFVENGEKDGDELIALLKL